MRWNGRGELVCPLRGQSLESRLAAQRSVIPTQEPTTVTDKSDILSSICQLVGLGEADQASALLEREYPFQSVVATPRAYGPVEALKIFRRDGFVDRYSGTRLIFPGVLRVLSNNLPRHFPYHPNWKMSETHVAYWELYPTVDHVAPVTRGGLDAPENWVTTSMLRNSAKGNWTLEELGWTLHSVEDRNQWDGLESWFMSYVERNPELKQNAGIGVWYKAAVSASAG